MVEPHHCVQHQWLNFECKYPQLCVWNYICRTQCTQVFSMYIWLLVHDICFWFSTSMEFLQRMLTIFKTQSYGLEDYRFQCNWLQFIDPMCWHHMIIKFCKNVLKLWMNLFVMLIFGPIDNCVQYMDKWFLYVLCGMLDMVEVLNQMLLPFSWSIGQFNIKYLKNVLHYVTL